MAAYGVHRMVDEPADPRKRAVNRRNAVLVVVALVVLVGVPLTISTVKISRDTALEAQVRAATVAWADDREWLVLDVQADNDDIVIRVAGPPPLPDTSTLAAALEAEGVDPADVTIELIPKTSVALG